MVTHATLCARTVQKEAFCAILVLFFACCATSCASNNKSKGASSSTFSVALPATEEDFAQATVLSHITGLWVSPDGSGFEFPFYTNGKTYLRFFSAWQDATDEWLAEAQARALTVPQGTEIDALWAARFTLPYYIEENALPFRDQNGTEMGIKFLKQDGKVFRRTEILTPELIASQNIQCFWLSQDGARLTQKSAFHFFSETIKNKEPNGAILTREDF